MSSIMELQTLVHLLEEQVKNLQSLIVLKESMIHQQEEEIQQLHSQIDKFQSVIPYGSHFSYSFPFKFKSNNHHGRQRARGHGISAEPRDLKTLKHLCNQTYDGYSKSVM